MTYKENIKAILECSFAGFKEEIIDSACNRILEQEPCEDEYIKIPKKALKYRTAGMIAYNAEWLKNHFDIERAVICGAQQPSDDAISRQAVLDMMQMRMSGKELYKAVYDLPPVNPQPCKDTRMIDKSNFNMEQYKTDIQSAYDCGKASVAPCEDCISRQVVLDIVDSYSESKSNVEDVTQDIISDIVALPPVNPQKSKWIPVSERLPEEYKTVMASTDYFAIFPEARYTKDGWEWAYESGADYWEELANVIAWMPLPAPYKMEREE